MFSTYAGYFSGSVYLTGTVNANVRAFKIDHPLDPENKYLSHSCVESPDMKNVYDGVAVLGSDGSAWVDLPEWFEALNDSFRYQLTAIGAPGPNLFIAQKISGNRFRIAGGRAGAEVSWQVTGIRKDASAMAHRVQVEQDKPQAERGLYLDAQAFGLGRERSIDYVVHERGVDEQRAAQEQEWRAGLDARLAKHAEESKRNVVRVPAPDAAGAAGTPSPTPVRSSDGR